MQEAKTGPSKKRKIIIGLSLLLAAAGVIVFLILRGIEPVVDFFWYDSLGYSLYFFLRKLYRYGVFVLVTLFFFGLFFLNFRIAARLARRARARAAASGDDPKDPARFSERSRNGSVLIYGAVCLALAIMLALPAFQFWERFLFFLFGPAAGLEDPLFGRDVSFFLFRYPVYVMLQKWLLIAFGVLLAGTFAVYAFDRNFFKGSRRLPKAGKRHLGILILVLFVIWIWHNFLQMFGLVYYDGNLPTFHGPGHVQMNVTLPLIWLTIILLAFVAVALMVVMFSRRGKKVLVVAALVLALVGALRATNGLERLVQKYVVEPNELSKETPYMAANIAATLDAYQLNEIETRPFRYERFPEEVPMEEVQTVLRNIPLWNEPALETVFHQLQELRSYYIFPPVSVDRYTIDGDFQQVFLSPREIDYENLPGSAQNWINRHLTYTHGFGNVMVPASQEGGGTMRWYIRGIPPRSDYGLETEQPRIYYGRENYNYVIAPNSSRELDYPLGNDNVTNAYDGRGGVPVGSFFKKLLFAWYFKEQKILFTTKTTRESKIMFRRNVIERVRHLAPFLRLDEAPYVVQTSAGIYWIIDAYTTSGDYPVSAPYLTPTTDYNYMRNSVKIVVDAYHGSVHFYVYDESDPIVRAYRRIYPGVFRDKESMPEALRKHVRYPKDFFNVQMRIYARYHQKQPFVFYHQEDLWTFADTIKGDEIVQFKPYYLTLNLVDRDRLDFLLLLPMMPKDRNNMRALAYAASDEPHYGKIFIYDFPKGELVYGPQQIDAIINQDPVIAELFTLWDQSGSSVQRGDMIMLPVADSVLFIQPVYLISRADVRIPELQRVIMSDGQVAVIDSSLESAYIKLRERIEVERGQQTRSSPAEIQPPGPERSGTAPPAARPPAEAIPPEETPPEATPPAP